MEVGEDGALAPPPESGRRRRGRGRRKAAEEEEEEEEDMMGMSAPAAPAAQAYNQSYKYDIGLEVVSFVVIFSTCSKTALDISEYVYSSCTNRVFVSMKSADLFRKRDRSEGGM